MINFDPYVLIVSNNTAHQWQHNDGAACSESFLLVTLIVCVGQERLFNIFVLAIISKYTAAIITNTRNDGDKVLYTKYSDSITLVCHSLIKFFHISYSKLVKVILVFLSHTISSLYPLLSGQEICGVLNSSTTATA